MPIYEYQCTACGHQLEALQKMSDQPLKECPECKQKTLAKLVSAAGFQLKGSGWYVTDYSKKGQGKSGEQTGSGGSASDSSSGTKSESKKDNSGSAGA